MPGETLYCTTCARPGDAAAEFCPSCGARRTMGPARHAGHVAFLLNQLRLRPFTDVLSDPQRARLQTHYEEKLNELAPPVETRRAVPTGAVVPPVAASSLAPVAEIAAPGPVLAPPAPPRAPRPPREPYDWRWLAEQQANLFLFAGAFLTVVAALIYVGYSGQAVSGALKMALLAGYTLAFLASGYFCLRIPRVETAGRVFFAVGALLVPMNFVAARSIFSGDDLSPESMWLAGSAATAAFYFAVAWLGLGRTYALGAAAALLSGTLAAVVVADLPVEWSPLAFIVISLAMWSTDAGPETLRDRVGSVWSPIAQIVAPAAAAFALLVAPFDGEDAFEVSTRWYLPLTFAAFAAVAAIPMLDTRRAHFGAAAIAGFAAAWVSVVYALEQPAEAYVIAFAALAPIFGALLLGADDKRVARILPAVISEHIYYAGIAATAAAGLIAIVILQAANEPVDPYVPATRWFLTAAFALSAAFYLFDAFERRQHLGVWGSILTVSGVCLSVVYGLDLAAETYVIVLAGLALFFGVVMVAAAGRRIAPRLHQTFAGDVYYAGIAATLAAVVGAAAVFLAEGDASDTYELTTRWFLAPSFALAAAFYLLDAFACGRRLGVSGSAFTLTGVCVGVVYGLDVSAEYYAFALIVPAVALGAALAWAPDATFVSRLHAMWRADLRVIGRVATAGGLLVATIAVLAGADLDSGYTPDSRWFLPASFAAAAAFLAIDASRAKRVDTSAALLLVVSGIALAVPYVLEAEAAWYGLALVATGIGFAGAGRAWTPLWLAERARDGLAAAGVVASTLPFLAAYGDEPRIGAAVFLAAAFFFSMAAIAGRGATTIGDLLAAPEMARVPLSLGWLYAAGLSATIGYVYVLRTLPAAEDAEAGSLALPLATASLVLLVIGLASRLWRPEFRMHLYLVALLVGLASLSLVPDAGTLAAVLTVYVVAYLALAVLEDVPALAAPAAVFGFFAIAAWREYAGASEAIIPLAFSLVAVAAYALALATLSRAPQWSAASRIAGATYGLVAPAAGFAIIVVQAEGGFIGATPYETTALYQWSTLAVALVGALALVESVVARRRWIIVPASTVLTIALLLQIGRFQPENVQVYTAVIGVYLVLLAVVGLSRLRLLPEFEPSAVYLEALGAATVMLPSFVQSIDDGWSYQVILLVEAATFLSGSIALRRRGMLATSLLFMVLVAGRELVDAVNALPNWIVVLSVGMALLAAGTGVLVGRDRWDQWQRALLSWWDEAGNGATAG